MIRVAAIERILSLSHRAALIRRTRWPDRALYRADYTASIEFFFDVHWRCVGTYVRSPELDRQWESCRTCATIITVFAHSMTLKVSVPPSEPWTCANLATVRRVDLLIPREFETGNRRLVAIFASDPHFYSNFLSRISAKHAPSNSPAVINQTDRCT